MYLSLIFQYVGNLLSGFIDFKLLKYLFSKRNIQILKDWFDVHEITRKLDRQRYYYSSS